MTYTVHVTDPFQRELMKCFPLFYIPPLIVILMISLPAPSQIGATLLPPAPTATQCFATPQISSDFLKDL